MGGSGTLRVRGWAWLLSMLWVAAGAVGTAYDFYITTKPYTWDDVSLGIEGWSADPWLVQIAIAVATVVSLVLAIPLLLAGVVRLRGWRPRNCLRAIAWTGAWVAGSALMYQSDVWGQYLGTNPAIPSPVVVSWGELAICPGWLVLGSVMTQLLGRSAQRRDVPGTSSIPSRKATR